MSNCYTHTCFGLLLTPEEIQSLAAAIPEDACVDITRIGDPLSVGPDGYAEIEIASEGELDIDALNTGLQQFMVQEQLPGTIQYSYAYTAHRPNYGDFGGGVAIVTRESVFIRDTGDILREEVNKRHAPSLTVSGYDAQSTTMRSPMIAESPAQRALAYLDCADDCISAMRDAVNGIRMNIPT
jgi:hypothetical protein